jgi:hypothetical protein
MSQDWSLTPAAAAPPPVKGKGMIWTGAVLLVVGMLLVVAGIIGVVASAASLINGFGSPVTTPTTVTRTLEAGTTYAVYERSSLVSGSGTLEDPLLASVSPADITVTGPGGVVVPVKDPGQMTQTFTNGGKEYFAVATFDAPASGSYEITIAGEGAEVLVAPSFSAFGRSIAWVAAIGLGGLLALVGLVLLIIGLVRRASSKKAAPTPYAATAYGQTAVAPTAYQETTYQQPGAVPTSADPFASPSGEPAQPVQPVQPVAPPVAAQPAPPVSPPAGWYPDPGRPGGQRYWDGSAWTEHTA